jgi:AcrR family transcriptional regulator
MLNTRDRIKEKALEMFNSDGVEVVTTRHIAAALNMSQGNLHYHFPNKNALILALHEDLKNWLKESQRFRGGPFQLSDLRDSVADHFALMWHYRFFFQDRDVVWRRVPRIARESCVFMWRTRKRLRSLITHLISHGMLSDQFSQAQYEAFIEAQFAFVAGWIFALGMNFGAERASPDLHFGRVFCGMWTPYWTIEHQVAWNQMLQ